MSDLNFDIIIREPDPRRDYQVCDIQGKVYDPEKRHYSWYNFNSRRIYNKIYYHETKMLDEMFPEDLFIDGAELFAFGVGQKAGVKARLPWDKTKRESGQSWEEWENECTLYKEDAWRALEEQLYPARKNPPREFYVEYGGKLWKTNENGFVWPYVTDGFRWFDLREYKETIKKFKRSRKPPEKLIMKNMNHITGVRQMPNNFLAAYPRWLEAVESYGITQIELVHTEVIMHKSAASIMLDAILDRC